MLLDQVPFSHYFVATANHWLAGEASLSWSLLVAWVIQVKLLGLWRVIAGQCKLLDYCSGGGGNRHSKISAKHELQFPRMISLPQKHQPQFGPLSCNHCSSWIWRYTVPLKSFLLSKNDSTERNPQNGSSFSWQFSWKQWGGGAGENQSAVWIPSKYTYQKQSSPKGATMSLFLNYVPPAFTG